ncbi:hypothetical protein ATE67_19045 [Sphingopyxis sp. H050]|nr:hypothetical protein ATE67_19045 [Sphingopyxis sp. H050]
MLIAAPRHYSEHRLPIRAQSRGPPRCELQMTPPTIDVYAREIVMARVGHLIRRKQGEIEVSGV